MFLSEKGKDNFKFFCSILYGEDDNPKETGLIYGDFIGTLRKSSSPTFIFFLNRCYCQ